MFYDENDNEEIEILYQEEVSEMVELTRTITSSGLKTIPKETLCIVYSKSIDEDLYRLKVVETGEFIHNIVKGDIRFNNPKFNKYLYKKTEKTFIPSKIGKLLFLLSKNKKSDENYIDMLKQLSIDYYNQSDFNSDDWVSICFKVLSDYIAHKNRIYDHNEDLLNIFKNITSRQLLLFSLSGYKNDISDETMSLRLIECILGYFRLQQVVDIKNNIILIDLYETNEN